LLLKTGVPLLRTLATVKAPEQHTSKLLDRTVDLMFRIYVIRGECSAAAHSILKRKHSDAASVEDCARLDDTMAKVYRSLQNTVRAIQRSRIRKRRRKAE
jgi:hypothetical protein